MNGSNVCNKLVNVSFIGKGIFAVVDNVKQTIMKQEIIKIFTLSFDSFDSIVL